MLPAGSVWRVIEAGYRGSKLSVFLVSSCLKLRDRRKRFSRVCRFVSSSGARRGTALERSTLISHRLPPLPVNRSSSPCRKKRWPAQIVRRPCILTRSQVGLLAATMMIAAYMLPHAKSGWTKPYPKLRLVTQSSLLRAPSFSLSNLEKSAGWREIVAAIGGADGSRSVKL
jgi:hypothetical protein